MKNIFGFTAVLLLAAVSNLYSGDLLPDLKTSWLRLLSAELDTATIPGRTLLRFSNAIPNRGRGPLELRGGAIIGDKQEVFQRVYREDKTHWDRLAGWFIHHPQHNHIHFEDFAQYRLREITKNGGIGNIVVEGKKTSYCVRDSLIHNPFRKGFSFKSKYKTCDSEIQGISVGWADLYRRSLYDQWLDITGVADGHYWLESEANPEHLILEKNTENNTARIRICIIGDTVFEE